MNSKTILYNPGEKDRKELLEEFVVRTKVFDEIFEDIKTAKMEHPEQHYLLVGQRGSGKTTLLNRLFIEIDEFGDNSNLIPILFYEEQYFISDLVNVWELVAQTLEDHYGFVNLVQEVELLLDDRNSEEQVFNVLSKTVKLKGKKLILLIDNFGTLLDKLTELEVKRFREVLMTCSDLRVVAATPLLPDAVSDYRKPFLNFFKIVPLGGLTTKEINTLLLRLAQLHGQEDIIRNIISHYPSRIETLRRLTGGVIRTIALLFEIFIENEDGKSITDLQMTLDAVTPLYKHKMDDLSRLQQKIVDVVARNWDAISTKEIAAKTRMESKVVSAILGQLEKNQVIEREKTNTKNHLYRIKERFFNIWYLMRYGRRHDRQRVVWLVRFLESWCDSVELEHRVQVHLKNLTTGAYDESVALIMGQAYMECGEISSELKYEVASKTNKLLQKLSSSSKLDISDIELLKAVRNYADNDDIERALSVLEEVKTRVPQYSLVKGELLFEIDKFEEGLGVLKKISGPSIDPEFRMKALYLMGRGYDMIGEYSKALKVLKTSANLGYYSAAHWVGHLLEDAGKNKLAKKYYKKAIILGDSKVAVCLGKLYESEGKLNKAEELYNEAFKKSQKPLALDALGVLMAKKGEKDKAIEYLQKAIKLGRDASYINLGIVYRKEFKDNVNAEKSLKTAAEKKVKGAYHFLGHHYREIESYTQAKSAYIKSIKIDNNSASMHSLAHLYDHEFEDLKRAEKYFRLAIDNGSDAYACLFYFYFYNEMGSKKLEALEIAMSSMTLHDDLPSRIAYSTALLWNDQIDDSLKLLSDVLQVSDFIRDYMEEIIDYFVLLMAKHQFHSLKMIFDKYKVLEDAYKPIYFTLMKFLAKEYPTEFIKMGEEMSETVDEIEKQVLLYRAVYN